MGRPSFNLSKQVLVVQPYANIDWKYGPWASEADAKSNVPAGMREMGLTVGILPPVGDTVTGIKEYWWKMGIADAQLIEKTTGSSGGVSPSSVNTALESYTEGTPGDDHYLFFSGSLKIKFLAFKLLLVTAWSNTFASKSHTHGQADVTGLSTALNSKVDKNGTDRLITVEEATKLSSLNMYYKGSHLSLVALTAAYPAGQSGWEAIIDEGVGSDAKKAIWDVNDGKWVIAGGTAITTDQAINEGSLNPVAGGAVYAAVDTLTSNVSNLSTNKEDKSNKVGNNDGGEIETYKSSTTKYPAIKAMYNWATSVFTTKEETTLLASNVKTTLVLYKNNTGSANPRAFKWPSSKTVSNVLLMSNCSGISVTIGASNYNQTTLVGVTLLANTEMLITDLTISSGDYAEAIIIF